MGAVKGVRRAAGAEPTNEDLDPEDDKDLKIGPTKDGGVNIDLEELRREAGEDGGERKAKTGGEARDRIEDRGGLDDADAEREAEERRQRRREERRDRKEANERRDEQRDAELTAVREELSRVSQQLATRQGESARETVQRIDARMDQLRDQYEQGRSLKIKALANKENPEEAARAAVEADEAIISARSEFDRLTNMRERVINEIDEERRRPRYNMAELKRNADDFTKEYDWFNPKGGDKDSRVVMRLDRELGAENKLKPDTAAYWSELGRRVREELPHRFEDDDPDREERGARREQRRDDRDEMTQRRSHVGGGSRETAGGGGNVFHLSKERVDAMKEAGMWDDPKSRASMIARYKKQDREKAQSKKD